jgi:hypothetical protein
MSSYYTTAELEAMRKARLKQELAESIQRLKEQLQIKHNNNIKMEAGSNIETTVFISDDIMSGYSGSSALTGSMLATDEGRSVSKRDILDFSELLCSVHKKPTKLEMELDLWIHKVDERPIIEEKDEKDRTRLLAELTKIISESKTDIEDKIKAVKMRVSTFLQGASKVTQLEKKKMESTYFEYCALCELLDLEPSERVPYRVEREILKMTSILEKRRQDEYVMDVIQNIMEDLGCNVKNDAILDHTVGQVYSIDGHPLCDVFIGSDGRGIMFEPIGESKDVSLERKRLIESSANSICSMYSIVEERAAEKGVILKRIYAEPVSIDKMCIQSDIWEGSSKKKQRKTTTQKERGLRLED